MQEDEESREFEGRPSKSARKREAAAAQDLGERLIALKESDLVALALPERLHEAILLANGTEANHTPEERVSGAAIVEMLAVP